MCSSLCLPRASECIVKFLLSFDNQIITVIIFRMMVTENMLFKRKNGPQKHIILRILGFLSPSIILLILANFKTFTMVKY